MKFCTFYMVGVFWWRVECTVFRSCQMSARALWVCVIILLLLPEVNSIWIWGSFILFWYMKFYFYETAKLNVEVKIEVISQNLFFTVYFHWPEISCWFVSVYFKIFLGCDTRKPKMSPDIAANVAWIICVEKNLRFFCISFSGDGVF